jgi:site-specific recombinase XerD
MTALRNRALIAVLYRSGLRISEALALYPKDIDFATGAIRVLHGKGDKSRTVGIDAGAIEYVQQWLIVRQRWGTNGCHPIFCSRSGQQLGEGYIRRLFPDLGRKAGIQKRVHPHGLRHTHAAQLREEGIDVGIISKQLGHVSIATTARYLDHIAPAALLSVIGQRRWPSESSQNNTFGVATGL